MKESKTRKYRLLIKTSVIFVFAVVYKFSFQLIDEQLLTI